MRTSSILTILLASCASARVIPSFLHSTTADPSVIARTAEESLIVRSEETSVVRGIRETIVPGRGPRLDDIVELELVR